MHPSAMKLGKIFFDTYLNTFPSSAVVVDVGAQNVNGTLREVCPNHFRYLGIDCVSGDGVDIVLDDPYQFPFSDNSVDAIVCSSVFEHTDMFWLTFLEVMRALKPSGLFYLNVPSNGAFHRYPVDCWRFYPDSGTALVTWARKNNYKTVLMESFTGLQDMDTWNDFVAVFLKDEGFLSHYPDRMVNHYKTFTNGCIYGEPDLVNRQDMPEDLRRSLSLLSN